MVENFDSRNAANDPTKRRPFGTAARKILSEIALKISENIQTTVTTTTTTTVAAQLENELEL